VRRLEGGAARREGALLGVKRLSSDAQRRLSRLAPRADAAARRRASGGGAVRQQRAVIEKFNFELGALGGALCEARARRVRRGRCGRERGVRLRARAQRLAQRRLAVVQTLCAVRAGQRRCSSARESANEEKALLEERAAALPHTRRRCTARRALRRAFFSSDTCATNCSASAMARWSKLSAAAQRTRFFVRRAAHAAAALLLAAPLLAAAQHALPACQARHLRRSGDTRAARNDAKRP
jgi:hypothetical protein